MDWSAEVDLVSQAFAQVASQVRGSAPGLDEVDRAELERRAMPCSPDEMGHVFHATCDVVGCECQAVVYSSGHTLISRDRVIELCERNGWTATPVGHMRCPGCSEAGLDKRGGREFTWRHTS
jgi:hypothetical protein